jgi:hypothetical protein
MRLLRLSQLVLTLLVCFRLTVHAAPLFSATPLTDFVPGQKYLGVFPGYLYATSNTLPVGSLHDLDGRGFAAHVQPLDASGVPDPTAGKIVVVGLGMSNWTYELCHSVPVTSTIVPPCTAASFFKNARANPFVNNTALVFIDCAANSQMAGLWVDDRYGLYTRCSSVLAANQVTEKQVQVILWKDADQKFPTVSLSPTTNCLSIRAISAATPEACRYIFDVAKVARFVKTQYPNLQQMFLHSRIYAGYAASLSPEPYAYEYGFATKWLIQAQIDQIQNGRRYGITGDLSYTVAPWLAWGPYCWADGPDPRSDGYETTWNIADFVSDGTHPSELGVEKVTLMMLHFYLNSPYSPWFRK